MVVVAWLCIDAVAERETVEGFYTLIFVAIKIYALLSIRVIDLLFPYIVYGIRCMC